MRIKTPEKLDRQKVRFVEILDTEIIIHILEGMPSGFVIETSSTMPSSLSTSGTFYRPVSLLLLSRSSLLQGYHSPPDRKKCDVIFQINLFRNETVQMASPRPEYHPSGGRPRSFTFPIISSEPYTTTGSNASDTVQSAFFDAPTMDVAAFIKLYLLQPPIPTTYEFFFFMLFCAVVVYFMELGLIIFFGLTLAAMTLGLYAAWVLYSYVTWWFRKVGGFGKEEEGGSKWHSEQRLGKRAYGHHITADRDSSEIH